MAAQDKRPILVTGSHRSGSTWVGKMLSLGSGVGYIHEPFNIECRPGICGAGFTHWFTHVCEENEDRYLSPLERTLGFRYDAAADLRAAGGLRELPRILRTQVRFARYRLLGRRPLMKDPIAVFSAEWLVQRFGMAPVVLIRHPAAFAGSLKKANWTFPFDHLLQQPLLMRQLEPYRATIEEYATGDRDVIDQAILLWNLIHQAIARYRERYPEWIFLTHEALSREPVRGFSDLYRRLGLRWNGRIEQQVERHCFPQGRNNESLLRRDSRSNIQAWKERLSDAEIERIRRGTDVLASRFYGEEDW